MSNLINTLKALATKPLIDASAQALDEQTPAIHKAYDSVLPLILARISHLPSEKHVMVSDLLRQAATTQSDDLIKDIQQQNNESVSLNIGNMLLTQLFDQNTDSLNHLIAKETNIRAESAASLLTIATTLIAQWLGHKMKSEQLSLNSILAWLGQHQQDLNTVIAKQYAVYKNQTTPINNTNNNINMTEINRGKNKWIFPVLILALLGIGLFWWLKGCNHTSNEAESNATAVIDSAGASIDEAVNKAASTIDTAMTNGATEVSNGSLDESGNWIARKGEPTIIKLDNGVEIEAFKGSLEDKLYAFIKDPGAMPGKDIWFSFDDLLFESGKSVLKKGFEKQLENTCEILKAYPDVKIKLGGYTDNEGDSTKNVTLSTARAKTVYQWMIGKGLTKSSFDEVKPYEGYGPQHPVADNTSPEGRAQNRRISLSVRAK